MANIPVPLLRQVLPVSGSPVTKTVPAGKIWIITNIVLVNYSANTVSAWVSLNNIVLIPNIPLSASAILTFDDFRQVLSAGQTLSASASLATSITAHISGVESDA